MRLRDLVVPLALLAPLGCTTALDVERAREIFASGGAPEPPVLQERPAAELAGVDGLRAVSGLLREIPLRWDPVLEGDVGGYAVERALGEEGPFQRIAVLPGRFATTFTDRGKDLVAKHGAPSGAADLGDDRPYTYRVRAYDAAGHLAAATSPPVTARTAAPPEAPRGLTVWSHLPRMVALSWDPVEDPTVAGYVVHRSPSARGDFRPVARLQGTYETSWVDPGLGPLRVFYYRVAAVNAAGGEGRATGAERAVTKAEPLPPAGLHVAERRLGANLLAWDANVEPDVVGYRLQRHREDGEGWETVARTDAATRRAEDPAVGAGESVRYRVVVVDRDGLASDPSDPVEVESVDYGLVAEASPGTVRLRWDRAVQEGFREVRVLREGTFGESEVARVRESEFVHRDLEPGQHLRYRVIGVRPDGREAPPSRVVEVTVPRAAASR